MILKDKLLDEKDAEKIEHNPEKDYNFYCSHKDVKQFEIWKVEWRNNPKNIQLVVIVQTNYLNMVQHFSYIVCPLGMVCNQRFSILRMNIGVTGHGGFDILVDQLATISGEALVEKVNELDDTDQKKIRRNLGIVLGFTL